MANDPKDRHVLAAVRGQAHAVVTLNVKDFPPEASDPYEIEVMRPDDVLLDMLDLAPVETGSVLRAQVDSCRREPRDLHGLLDRLDAGGAPRFAAEFRRRLRPRRAPPPGVTAPAAVWAPPAAGSRRPCPVRPSPGAG
ncbi:hypothetical protein ABWJ92_25400 [Streptomyces sp. NPDC000609]|uniref:hypothetical protein n=1 Tax=Streptomyces sp. NPDC000609 TaxID=3160957 RepID=UPI00339690BF